MTESPSARPRPTRSTALGRTVVVLGTALAVMAALPVASSAASTPADASGAPAGVSSRTAPVPAIQAAPAALRRAKVVPGLSVSITGLPRGVRARVLVTGPKQTRKARTTYRRALTASTVLPRLAKGSYVVRATSIAVATGTLVPAVARRTVKVTTTRLTRVAVAYRLVKKPAPPAPAGRWNLTLSPTPFKATVATDAPRAASALIPRAGGVLTTTGADGVTYTLTVPGNALTADTTITMTPLTGPIGVPLGESSYGVKLEPDGLQFVNFVSLKVTPAAGMSWPVDHQVPLGIDGASRTVELAPLVRTSAVPVIQLLHFSSYAVLLSEKGMNASLNGVRDRIGGSAERRISSALAEKLGIERQHQLLGYPEDFTGLDIVSFVKEYVVKVLQPRLAAAGTSCAAGRLAIQTLLGVERQLQLLGTSLEAVTGVDAMALLNGPVGDAAAEVCVKEEYEICRDEHIITRMVPVVLGFYRQEQLLGADPEVPTKRHQIVDEYARKCLQFEVQLDSSVTISETVFPRHTTNETVTSRLKMGFGATILDAPLPPALYATAAIITGPSTPLVSTAYDGTYSEPCHQSSAYTRLGGSSIGLLGYVPGSNTPQTPGGANTVTDFNLVLALSPSLSGVSHHTLVTTGSGNTCNSPPDTTQVDEGWFGGFADPWLSSIVTGENGSLVTGWSIVGNADVMATKDVTLNVPASGSSTATAKGTAHLVLFHKPLP